MYESRTANKNISVNWKFFAENLEESYNVPSAGMAAIVVLALSGEKPISRVRQVLCVKSNPVLMFCC